MNAGLTKIAPLVRAAPKRTFVRPSMPVKGGQHYVFEPKSGPVGEKLRVFFWGGHPVGSDAEHPDLVVTTTELHRYQIFFFSCFSCIVPRLTDFYVVLPLCSLENTSRGSLSQSHVPLPCF